MLLNVSQVIVAMAVVAVLLGQIHDALARELAHHIVHGIAVRRVIPVEQRFRHQRREDDGCLSLLAHHPPGGLDREPSLEDRTAGQGAQLGLAQQPPRRFEHRPQTVVAGGQVMAPAW